MFILGGGYLPQTLPQAFGALSVLLAFGNISGGFVITKRMLDMFRRESLPPLPRQVRSRETDGEQAPLIPRNTPGSTLSPVSSSAAASSPPPPPAPRVSSRLGTSSARFSASGRSRASRARPRRAWATCSACWAWGQVCLRRCLRLDSRLRFWCSLGVLRLWVALLVGFPCSLMKRVFLNGAGVPLDDADLPLNALS